MGKPRHVHGGRVPQGFTLLELMIALSIAAILAAVAWPGYRQVMLRSQRIEARLALLKIQYLQERHFADHHAFSGTLSPTGPGLPIAALSEHGNYQLSIRLDANGQGYQAIARARSTGRQAGDAQCQQFSLDTTGTRRSADASGRWRIDQGGGCWG
jgi:type IV pilus assembly protein PilE